MKTEIKGVRVKKQKLYVIIEDKIFVYNFKQFKMEKIMKTGKNPRGLCCILQEERDMFVFPAEGNVGSISVVG